MYTQPQPGALNELFIEVGVEFSPLTAQSTQSQGQPPADRSAILEDFFCGWRSGESHRFSGF